MNYELAKKLKDAGFPQRDWGDIYSCEKEHELLMIPQKLRASSLGINVGKTISCPTLIELIAVCTENMPHFNLNLRHGLWIADFNDDFKKTGLTPSEAVAMLWLALNKK